MSNFKITPAKTLDFKITPKLKTLNFKITPAKTLDFKITPKLKTLNFKVTQKLKRCTPKSLES